MSRVKINYKFVCLALAVLLAGAAVCGFIFIKPRYQPSFIVTGDVQDALKINSMDGFSVYNAEKDGKGYRGVMLQDIITKAVPLSQDYTIVIRGDDGLLAQVDGKQIDGMYAAFTAENGWEMINEYHPPSSNIKRIKEIWVVSGSPIPEKSISIISKDKDIASYTPGQFFMSETGFAPVFQGTSVKKSGDKSYGISVYTEERYRRVTDIAPEAQYVLAMGGSGEYGFGSSPGTIVLSGNSFKYVYSDGKTSMEDVRGILINPPGASNMDVYRETANNIDAGKRVLVIVIDGLGYSQYEYAVREGCAPGLASLKAASMAASEYRPVTNTGLAAILTGQPPYINGIWDRGMTELKAPDIFGYAADKGKKWAYIEGSVKILGTSAAPQLNADRNDNGTDDEVFGSAKEAISSGADIVFAHFHGADDAGHSYGPLNVKTLEKIREIDSYISKLTNGFYGTVIITADHGMHSAGGGGDHGEFRYEDIIVPYLSFYAGQISK